MIEDTNLNESSSGTAVNVKLSLDMIAKRLLEENFILTALELHFELLESGRELHRLRDYFSNPANFEHQTDASLTVPIPNIRRSGSVQTFDSADFPRSSDDEDEAHCDDRFAVLEFELRKARETIKTLRQQLTIAHSNATPSSTGTVTPKSASVDILATVSSANPSEKRALNFLINEYLMQESYKITAVTFSEEAENQDFELWDDVGIDMPRPESLLAMYKELCHKCAPPKVARDAACMANVPTEYNPFLDEGDSLERMEEQTELLNRLNEENSHLMKRNELLSHEVEQLKVEVTQLDMKIQHFDRHANAVQPTAHDLVKMKVPFAVDKPGQGHDITRHIPDAFRKHVLATLDRAVSFDSRLYIEMNSLPRNGDDMVKFTARCLPHIVPNVLLNKRDELLPVLLACALLHPDPKERDGLLGALFNLVKRPDDEQRRLILAGCVSFSRHGGSVDTELLPQCWEQISHKYIERRLLVAEACGVLAAYVAPNLIGSLVLSMLQQMLDEDKSELVREAVVKSLAVISMYIEDVDKFAQVSDLVMKTLLDNNAQVVQTCRTVFLPAVAFWAMELGKLENIVLATILKKISSIMLSADVNQPANEPFLCMYWSCLQSLLPFLFYYVLNAGPYIGSLDSAGLSDAVKSAHVVRYSVAQSALEDLSVLAGDRLLPLTHAYDAHTTQEWFHTWTELEFLTKDMLPQLIACLDRLDVAHTNLVKACVAFFHRLCQTFNHGIAWSKIRPLFEASLRVPPDMVNKEGIAHFAICKATLPVYVSGVLASHIVQSHFHKELCRYLSTVIVTLATSNAPSASAICTFTMLRLLKWWIPSEMLNNHDFLLKIIWDCVMHKNSQVKVLCAQLLHCMVGRCDEDLLKNRLIPALVTLASDADVNVRSSTVPGFGAALTLGPSAEVSEKVRVQLASFFDDRTYDEEPKLVVSVIRTLSQIAACLEVKFRDDFLLPRLTVIAARNNVQPNPDIKQAVAVGLFEVYNALSCCFMNEHTIAESFLPGARCVLRDLGAEHARILSLIMREMETKLTPAYRDRQGPLVADMSAGVGVMKTKMMDKFRDLKDKMDQPAFKKPY